MQIKTGSMSTQERYFRFISGIMQLVTIIFFVCLEFKGFFGDSLRFIRGKKNNDNNQDLYDCLSYDALEEKDGCMERV